MKAYQLKIAIKNTKPPIWRRCMIPAGLTFSQLSMVLNGVMGWPGYRLFEFEFYHSELVICEKEKEVVYRKYDFSEASTTFINEYMEKTDWFTYIYDYGSDWRHRVTIEKVITDYKYNYPQVLDYKGATPIEACRHLGKYYECLEIMNDKNHPEHKEKIKWAESQFYTGEYNIEVMNWYLKKDFTITYDAEGEKRKQKELYQDKVSKKAWLIASDTAKNKKKPIRSHEHREDDSLKQMADLMKRRNDKNSSNLRGESLVKMYNCNVKKEIIAIAKNHGMAKYSKYSKNELDSHVVDYILSPRNMEKYFSCLRDSEIKEFEMAIGQKERYKTNNIARFVRLLGGGYVGFFEGDIISIPADVEEAYKKINTEKFHKIRKHRSFLLDCFIAAGVLYGTAPVDIIAKIYNQNANFFMEGDLLNYNSIVAECEKMPNYLMDFEIRNSQFIGKSLLEGNRYKLLQRCQGDKDFYIPTSSEIEDLATVFCLPNEKSFRRLVDYLMIRLDVDAELAERASTKIQKRITAACKLEDLVDILEEYQIEVDPDEDLEELAVIIIDLWNDTRMIENRGFKPNELHGTGDRNHHYMIIEDNNKVQNTKVIDISQARKKKIHQNDPCPCGSGKKYKRCCGKLNG